MLSPPFVKRFYGIIDRWFVPESLQRDPERHRKAVLAVGLAVTLAIFSLGMAAAQLTTGRPGAAAITIGTAALLLVGPLALRATGLLSLCTNLILLIGFLSIVALGITARVQGAPALFWLGGIPLLAVALDRPKTGYVWTVICVCLIGTFWIFSAPGVELQADIPGSHWQSLNALSQTGLLVFSLAVGVALESSRARAFEELTETNRELAQSRLLAQRASEAKSVFIAHMSHEIRTPMTGVAGMAEALLDLELAGKQREYAENIASSATPFSGCSTPSWTCRSSRRGSSGWSACRSPSRSSCARSQLLRQTGREQGPDARPGERDR